MSAYMYQICFCSCNREFNHVGQQQLCSAYASAIRQSVPSLAYNHPLHSSPRHMIERGAKRNGNDGRNFIQGFMLWNGPGLGNSHVWSFTFLISPRCCRARSCWCACSRALAPNHTARHFLGEKTRFDDDKKFSEFTSNLVRKALFRVANERKKT